MKRLFVPALAALALTYAPTAAQTSFSFNAMTALNDGAYSFGPSVELSSVVATVDLGHIQHHVDDPTHQRDRLQVAGLGLALGDVVLSGHYGQAICAHTLDVYGASLWYRKVGVRMLRFEGENRLQAGIRLPIGSGNGSASAN